MNISYFDDARVTDTVLSQKSKKLQPYRAQIQANLEQGNLSVPEASLYAVRVLELHETVERLTTKYKKTKHLILIGIGGQTLGVEAIHAVLGTKKVELSVIDTVSVAALKNLFDTLVRYKKVSDILVCVSSKSGTTTETQANAEVVLEHLYTRFGDATYGQLVCISNAKTPLMQFAKKVQAECIAMPESIGGRFSIGTAAGIVPLALLGHDVDDFIEGFLDANHPTLEAVVADSAARLATYHTLGYPHYNFFAFETRLERLGAWYRQLLSESLGKAEDLSGKPIKQIMVPTISTPVELHSTGQLYMSGVPDAYTDFVTFDDEDLDIMLSKKAVLAKALKGHTILEVATAIYGGVIGAYQEKQLPYRATIFEDDLMYTLGQFMAMRMREIMYTAYLLNRCAFDQPNVELYKDKTRAILSL
jgi:glucose-6-phosphate isomerase